MTADGHGAVLLAEPTQAVHPRAGRRVHGRARPRRRAGARRAARGRRRGRATARTLLAVIGGDDPATLVAPTTADGVGRAVLRLDADGWHREPVDAPEPVHPVALAAAGPARAWMLATAGDRVVLLRRDPTAPRWVLTSFDDELLSRGREGRGRRAAGRPAHGHVRRALDRSSGHAARGDRARRPHGAPEGHRGARRPDADGHAHARPTATPTATATATPSATPTPAAPQLVVDGRWCDVEPLCDHALGFTFARGDRGYRSVATAATPDAKFGTREISAPVDRGLAPDARARDAQRQGGYAALEGEAFALRDGIGEDGSSTTQAIAFAADGTGFTGGTVAFGAVSRAAISPPPAAEPLPCWAMRSSPGRPRRPATAASSPWPARRGAMLYAPGRGWSRAYTPLLEIGAKPLRRRWSSPGRGRTC